MAYTERYMTVAGGGAHDGTSEANAWTLAEAITALTSTTGGFRVNVKKGTYTLTGNLTLIAGSSENPNEWVGYDTTPGDLASVGRATATGQLTVTNFPVFDGTTLYTVNMGGHNTLKYLHIKTAVNGFALTTTTAYTIFRCRLENTHATGANTGALNSSASYGSVTDCDMLASSTNASLLIVKNSRGMIAGCRVWHAGTPNAAAVGISNTETGCGCILNVVYNLGIGIDVGGTSACVMFNSVHSTTSAIRVSSAATLVYGNVIYSATTGVMGSTNSGNPHIFNNAMGSVTNRLDSTSLGSTIEEYGAITLTGDPFTNSSSRDYTLNNTAGAGALCRGAGTFFGGEMDIGAVQHTDAGGGGTTIRSVLFGASGRLGVMEN